MNNEQSFRIHIQVKEIVAFIERWFSFCVVLKSGICGVLMCRFSETKISTRVTGEHVKKRCNNVYPRNCSRQEMDPYCYLLYEQTRRYSPIL